MFINIKIVLIMNKSEATFSRSKRYIDVERVNNSKQIRPKNSLKETM